MDNVEKSRVTIVVLITMFISQDVRDVKRPEKYIKRIYDRCSKVLQRYDKDYHTELKEIIDTTNDFYIKATEIFREDNLLIHTGLIAVILSKLVDLSNPPYNLPDKLFTKMLCRHPINPTITQIQQAMELALYFREVISEFYGVEKVLVYKELEKEKNGHKGTKEV